MKKIDIFDLNKLSQPVCNTSRMDNVATNNMYGHAYVIKKYAGFEEDYFLNCTIEHGVNIDYDLAFSKEICHTNSRLLTYSTYRKEIYEKYTNKEVICIGPYIAYAQCYLDETNLCRLKKKYGRTLLVIPGHSIKDRAIEYDIKEFIEEIKIVGKNFDTVLVCLYYQDIINGYAKYYKREGFLVVSSGYVYDKNFLNRLKLYILMSEAVICNTFVSAISYSIFLDRPVYIVKQKIDYNDKVFLDNSKLIKKNLKWKNELMEICSDSTFGSLESQKIWGNYFFGFEHVKDKNEMRNIINGF